MQEDTIVHWKLIAVFGTHEKNHQYNRFIKLRSFLKSKSIVETYSWSYCIRVLVVSKWIIQVSDTFRF